MSWHLAMPFVWALMGAAVAVAVNLIADRWGRDLRLSGPRCLSCDAPRRGVRQLASTAYVARRRSCPACGDPIPLRHLLVELAMPTIFAFLAWHIAEPLTLGIISLHTAVLTLISIIDFETRWILNQVIYPAIAVAVLLAFVTPGLTARSALAGGAAGFVLTGLIYLGGRLFVKLQARRGIVIDEVAFGMGDVTLMLYIGLATGLVGVMRALAYGVLLGGAIALLILVAGAVRRQSALHIPFAYGPYLSLGAWIVLVQNVTN